MKEPRCWMMEKGGDRCVLVQDHPGAHMGGYHTFEKMLSPEELARAIGTHCDTLDRVLREKIAALQAENQRLRAEVATLTRCGADMADGLGRLTKQHARLVAACRKLRVSGPGGVVGWSGFPAVIAEFDAALAACEEVGQ